MRTLLLAAACLGFAAAPLAAHAAGATPADAAPGTVVAQSTTLPGVTVTAPAPSRWDITTWEFTWGPSAKAPAAAIRTPANGFGGGGAHAGGYTAGF